MAISVPTRASDAVSTDSPRVAVRSIPPVPKANAVRSLKEKLQSLGFSAGAATAMAAAAVDPADFRRRLERPAPVRVPGAVLETVEVEVWAPMVVPYVVNYREAEGRVFPVDKTVVSGKAPKYPPIRRPKGDSNGRPILEIEVRDRDHLAHAIDSSIGYLVDQNPMTDSIAEKGVMFPITLVATSVSAGSDGDFDVPATADGSSRAANALEVLGVGARDALGRFRRDSRTFAGFVGSIRTIFDRPLDEVSEGELARANALILPARIVIGFDPDVTGHADFAKAVHNYVQLIHGDLPPKPWPDTARIDAKADSVIAELEQADILTPNKAQYFEGMLAPTDARRAKLPASADERGLLIATTLSDPKGSIHAAIRRGVVQPSERKNLTKGVKAEIAAELALRGARGILTPKELSGAREVLSSVYQNPAVWEKKLKPSGRDPADLLKLALKELKTGKGGPATAELGALGAFWLTAHRVLREARFFASEQIRDGRAPSNVVSALMDSEWGLRYLARAVTDGRDGDVIWHVDKNGKRVKSATGEFMKATNELLRGSVVPPDDGGEGSAGNGDEDGGMDGGPPLPERVLLTRRNLLEGAVTTVEQRHQELREVLGGDGKPLVDSIGISAEVSDELRDRLEAIRTKLALYADKWSENESAEASDGDDGSIDDEEMA
jgi:hypothetical protein